MGTNRLKLTFKIIISFVFVGYLAFMVDWSIIVDALKKTNFKFYLLSTTIAFVSVGFVAKKYHLLICNTSISQPIVSLIKIIYICRFYALFIPSSFGQELVKWYKITGNKKGRSFFLASIIYERLIHTFTLLIAGVTPLFFYSLDSEIYSHFVRLWPLFLVVIIITVIGLTYFISPAVHRILKSKLTGILHYSPRTKDIIPVLENFAVKEAKISSFVKIFVLSAFWLLFFVFKIYFLVLAIGVPLDIIDVIWMGSQVFLLQIIPISFAGIGVREGAYAYLFSLFMLPPEHGVLIGLLIFSQEIVFAGFGGIFELLDTRNQSLKPTK